MRDLELRPARAADERRLAVLDRSWPPELQVAAPTAVSESFFAHRRPEDVIVAHQGERLVGFIQLAPHSSMAVNAHVLHVNAIVIEPGLRGSGIGRVLLDAAVREARTRGARKLGLRVLGSNDRAIRLYERSGFRLEGRLRGEFLLSDGRYDDDLWYALDLTAPAGSG